MIFLGGAAPSQGESEAANGVTEGTFAGIKKGEVARFLLKDKKGVEHSFLILKPDQSMHSYLENRTELRGRRVRVYWREQKKPVTEGGEDGREKVVTKVEARVK